MSTVSVQFIQNNFIRQKSHVSLSIHSFFLGELEKCLEDPDRLALLFVKQVRTILSLSCVQVFVNMLID